MGRYPTTSVVSETGETHDVRGLYDPVIAILKEAGKTVVELSGVMPNPTYDKMQEGCALVRNHAVDLILAVGGGSVIDCAKGIAVSAYCVITSYSIHYTKLYDNMLIILIFCYLMDIGRKC